MTISLVSDESVLDNFKTIASAISSVLERLSQKGISCTSIEKIRLVELPEAGRRPYQWSGSILSLYPVTWESHPDGIKTIDMVLASAISEKVWASVQAEQKNRWRGKLILIDPAVTDRMINLLRAKETYQSIVQSFSDPVEKTTAITISNILIDNSIPESRASIMDLMDYPPISDLGGMVSIEPLIQAYYGDITFTQACVDYALFGEVKCSYVSVTKALTGLFRSIIE